MRKEQEHDAGDRGGHAPGDGDEGLKLTRPRGPLDQLRTWFERDLVRPTWGEVDVLVARPEAASIRSSTRRFTYTIHADVDGGDGYLGCTCTLNGERRGRDLPDGPLAESTWLEVLADLVDQEGDDATPVR
jgi:hypothetical protein